MNRRDFLVRAGLIAAGAVAADQLELLERLAPRRLFPAWPSMPTLYGDGVSDDYPALQAMIDGKPVWDDRHRKLIPGVESNLVRPEIMLMLGDGKHRLSNTITVHRSFAIHGGRFVTNRREPFMEFGDEVKGHIEGAHFIYEPQFEGDMNPAAFRISRPRPDTDFESVRFDEFHYSNYDFSTATARGKSRFYKREP